MLIYDATKRYLPQPHGIGGVASDNTVIESTAADTIFSNTAGSANWLLYSFSLDTVSDTKATDVLENLDP